MEDRRLCKFCGVEFFLTPKQKRQVRERWPVNCSRSCARKAQHERNHGAIRTKKKCQFCSGEFTVTNWSKHQIFCSRECSNKNRFGNIDKESSRKKIFKILTDEPYLRFINNKAKSLASKYGVESDDLIQDYFLSLLKGHNCLLEQSAMETIRKEYNRGVVGKRKANGVITGIESVGALREARSFLCGSEFSEYMMDLKATLDEDEFKIAWLKILGLGYYEAYERRDSLTKRQFNEIWRFLKQPTP